MGQTTPTAETESAGSYADVSEETLARLVSQITPENSYVIVKRDDRPDGYAQTAIARTFASARIRGSMRPADPRGSQQQGLAGAAGRPTLASCRGARSRTC